VVSPMTRLAGIFIVCMVGTSSFAGGSPPASPRSVASFEIAQAGLSEHTDEASVQACMAFQPPPAEVKKFLEHASKVRSRVHTHDHYSPCYAKGTVALTNGKKGDWQIHSGGTGIIRIGSQGAAVFRCRDCQWDDPFQVATTRLDRRPSGTRY
jgi:hypothetical protein